MSFSLVVHDTLALDRTKKRTPFLTRPRRADAPPIPPTLVNSPYLSSPDSVFRRKTSVSRWPSSEDDEWLRDMVPVHRSLAFDADAGSNDPTPSPTSSDSSCACSLCPPSSSFFPPSPMLRPRSASPDVATHKRAMCGSGSGQSLHS